MRYPRDPYKIHEDGGMFSVKGPGVQLIYWKHLHSAETVRTLCNIAHREGRNNAPMAYKKRLKK